MYSSIQLAKKYFHYYRTAFNSKGHGMHSPFVFDFILNVLNNKSHYTPPPSIEVLRKQLSGNKEVLEIEDLGAGSRTNPVKQRTVSQLVKTALKPKKYAQLLYRLAKHYQPQSIIELGTSLGITTCYLAAANPSAKIITIEGSEAVAHRAAENFKKLSLTNIQLLQGNFDTILPSVINKQSPVDMAYIDGNHRYQPTINYFHQLLSKSCNNTILIFDDIHWSTEMEKAWEEIMQHPSVRCTIDIFFLGFVFFRNEFKEKQHFQIRF
ncbi:MAG: O-methyltransferase [Flavisolibacter sp.]|jgi:predicted O-methyltransferase YrrM